MKSQNIEKIRKRFHHEWLLIAVDKMDKATTVPQTGRLLTHSPDPIQLYKKARKSKAPLLMTVYSDDWPKDMAVCFHAHILF